MSAERRAAMSVLAYGIDRLLSAASPVGGDDDSLDVLDIGGGTGGLAVRLASAGHRVTVVDPSPDALAALARRAAEAGVEPCLRGIQGDAEGLGDLLADASVDLVLCHGVLEVVDEPAVALRAVRRVLRDTGRLSLLVAGRRAAVLGRANAGHLRQALQLVCDPDGRWGPDDPLLRRFDLDGVRDLLRCTGFELLEAEGVRVFTDLVPAAAVDGEPPGVDALGQLEEHARSDPAFVQIAAQLHFHAAPTEGPCTGVPMVH